MQELITHQRSGDGVLFVVGTITAACSGAVGPATGLMIVEAQQTLFEFDPDAIFKGALMFGLLRIGVAVATVAVMSIEYACFGRTGAHLTFSLRSSCMRNILRQEIGFFDEDANSSSFLTIFLMEKVQLVQALNGEKLAVSVSTMSTVVTGLTLIFMFGYWQLVLVLFGAMPVFAAATALQIRVRMGDKQKGAVNVESDSAHAAGAIVSEIVSGIRTVMSLSAERRLFNRYASLVDQSRPGKISRAWVKDKRSAI